MMRTIEVEVDDAGRVRSLEATTSVPQGRALLSWQVPDDHDGYVLSESALADDWMRPEEDEAWAHLQPGR